MITNMLITSPKIIKVLLDNSIAFDPKLSEIERLELITKITQEIMGVPVIQEARWITFTQIGKSQSGKTLIYEVRVKEGIPMLLGTVKWSTTFSSYAFLSMPDIILEPQCLNDIIHFLQTLAYLHRSPKK